MSCSTTPRFFDQDLGIQGVFATKRGRRPPILPVFPLLAGRERPRVAPLRCENADGASRRTLAQGAYRQHLGCYVRGWEFGRPHCGWPPLAGMGPARLGSRNLYSARAIRSRRLPVKTLLFLAPRQRAAALAALAALGLTACGRYGPLEPPPDASAAAKPAAAAAPATGADALSPQLKPKIPPITAPNQPFILDPLLK